MTENNYNITNETTDDVIDEIIRWEKSEETKAERIAKLEKDLKGEVTQAWGIVTDEDIESLLASENKDELEEQQSYLSETLYIAIYHLNKLRDMIRNIEIEDLN